MASTPLRIIDAHHHLWDLENLPYGWIKGPNQVEIHLAGINNTTTPKTSRQLKKTEATATKQVVNIIAAPITSQIPQVINLSGPLDPIRKSYLLDDFKEDNKNQNVVKSVHLQAECEDEIGETKWLQSIADKNGMHLQW